MPKAQSFQQFICAKREQRRCQCIICRPSETNRTTSTTRKKEPHNDHEFMIVDRPKSTSSLCGAALRPPATATSSNSVPSIAPARLATSHSAATGITRKQSGRPSAPARASARLRLGVSRPGSQYFRHRGRFARGALKISSSQKPRPRTGRGSLTRSEFRPAPHLTTGCCRASSRGSRGACCAASAARAPRACACRAA